MRKGGAWEAQLAIACAEYRALGVATVWQAHAREGRAKGPCDFVGALDGGRAITFEAKSTQETRWAFALLKDHQATKLDAVLDVGGVAGIAVRTAAGRFWLPWERLQRPWHRWRSRGARQAAASISRVMLPELGVEITTGRRLDDAAPFPDWLGALNAARRAV